MESTPETQETITPAEAHVSTTEQKRAIIFASILVVVLMALIGVGIYVLSLPTTDTPRIRDIFIIILAVESLVIGLTLIILLFQLARLINLLQNEIKPILDSTNETVSHLRGTTVFLSNNLVQPVIKLNEYLAGLSQLFNLIGLVKKPSKKKNIIGE